MAKTNSIVIEIDGDNIKAIRAIDGTETKLKSLGATANQQKGFFESMLGGFSSVAAVTRITLTGAALLSFGKDAVISAAQLGVLRENFTGSAEDVEKFRKATAGTVTEADLLKLSNQATDLGLTLQQQTILFSLAEDAADKYGGGVVENFSRVLKASEGGTKGLKELGIQKAEYDKIVKDYLQGYGVKNLEQLDAETQKWIQVEAVIKAAGVTLQDVANKAPDAADKIESIGVKWDTFKNKTGEVLIPVLGGVLDFIIEIDNWAIKAGNDIDRMLGLKGVMGDNNQGNKPDRSQEEADLAAALGNYTYVKNGKVVVEKVTKEANSIIQNTTKKGKDDWTAFVNSITFDAVTFGMTELDTELTRIDIKYEELFKKFKDKDLGFVKSAMEFEKAKAWDKSFKSVDESLGALNVPQMQLPELKDAMQITPAIDITEMEAGINKIKDKSLEVSTASAAHFGIIEMAGTDSFGMIGDSLMEFATLNGKTNKEMFAAAKAFSIGQAIMNTYEGASKAIAQGGIFGGIMAAGVIAMGMAQVARIASTQPGTSGGGGSVGSSISPNSLTNGSGARAYANSVTNNNSVNNKPIVTIHIHAESKSNDQIIRELGPAINKAINDGIIKFGNG